MTGTGRHFDLHQSRWSTASGGHPAANFTEFDLDQIVGGKIRADGAGAARKRINT
jgi:hypothetical protein